MHARFLLSLPCWLVTLGIALFVTPVQAEEWQPHTASWQLQKESAQRRIHTAPVAHSSFKAFKAETTIAQPIDAVLAVIAHPASCPLWVDGCLHSQSLGINSFSDRYGYALNDLPWPFRDRELIVHIATHVSLVLATIKRTDLLKNITICAFLLELITLYGSRLVSR